MAEPTIIDPAFLPVGLLMITVGVSMMIYGIRARRSQRRDRNG